MRRVRARPVFPCYSFLPGEPRAGQLQPCQASLILRIPRCGLPAAARQFCGANRIQEKRMLKTTMTLAAAALAIMLGQASTKAQGNTPAALTGKVTSAAEGAMEGVVVSAKKG